MRRTILCLGLLFGLVAPVGADTTSLFDFLHGLDGKTYPGRMSYPAEPAHEMNKPMQITIKVISDNEIRIPLQVGEDRSRTWILTRSDSGVLLKHDHRHADGTPDKVTNYGGLADNIDLGVQLVFPADQETATMLPEASSNAWSLRIAPDASKLYYYLERNAKPRFEAAFDLAPQPAGTTR